MTNELGLSPTRLFNIPRSAARARRGLVWGAMMNQRRPRARAPAPPASDRRPANNKQHDKIKTYLASKSRHTKLLKDENYKNSQHSSGNLLLLNSGVERDVTYNRFQQLSSYCATNFDVSLMKLRS
ncbi:hypothetical protein EVAR_45252_1 [Eumeta japonica]|uniref:Uncharacterized protein n=1 Tax=Eumeta variegata TaxID=151549 RepID=A0A4C1XDG1_EUMVA|nr:hypothetical protein EVAR_45252_1 [Eumeta japonica]